MKNLIGTQSYTWLQYCKARGQVLEDRLDDVFAQIVEAGIAAWEGYCTSPEQTDRLAGLLDRHGLVMPSIYAGAKLHVPSWGVAVEDVLRQADLARPLGVRIIVCNPDPIDWAGKQDKSDDELRRQAHALGVLTGELQKRGMTLAYHTHDAELRASAREFHHMLLATRDAGTKLCLDTHWIFRGAGDSNVALLDMLSLYADRIASVHLRQSHGGIWSETLGPGDVELEAVAKRLRALGFGGPLVLEICSEAGSPSTLSPVEAHRRGRLWVQQIFSDETDATP